MRFEFEFEFQFTHTHTHTHSGIICCICIWHLHFDKLMPHCGCCVISALFSCNVNRFANSFATATIYAFARLQLIETRTDVLTYKDTHTQQTDPYSPRALFNTCRRRFLSILFTFGTCATATATGKR